MPQIRSAVRQNAAEARDARARIARKKKARSTMVVENAELKECERAVHLHEQQKAKDAKQAAKDLRRSAKDLLRKEAGGDGAAPKKSSMCQVL